MVFYPMNEQLERIREEVEEFELDKPAVEMEVKELERAEQEAEKYVTWVKDPSYLQYIPMIKATGRKIYP